MATAPRLSDATYTVMLFRAILLQKRSTASVYALALTCASQAKNLRSSCGSGVASGGTPRSAPKVRA